MYNDSMVYLNKIYLNSKITSCPLITGIEASHDEYETCLMFSGPVEKGDLCQWEPPDFCQGGGDFPFGCGRDLAFSVESTEVLVNEFDLLHPENFGRKDLTVNGIPVDKIEYFNKRYMACTNKLMNKVSDCACMEKGLPTKTYLLLTNFCGWKAKLTIVLRGEVCGCGTCRKFKAIVRTAKNKDTVVEGHTTFADSALCLPCVTGGIAPVINFSFGAKATFLNPSVRVLCNESGNRLLICGVLITEPEMRVQVTRETLFKTNAECVNTPCDHMEKCKSTFGCCRDDEPENAFQLKERCCVDGSGHDPHHGTHCDPHHHCDQYHDHCCYPHHSTHSDPHHDTHCDPYHDPCCYPCYDPCCGYGGKRDETQCRDTSFRSEGFNGCRF